MQRRGPEVVESSATRGAAEGSGPGGQPLLAAPRGRPPGKPSLDGAAPYQQRLQEGDQALDPRSIHGCPPGVDANGYRSLFAVANVVGATLGEVRPAARDDSYGRGPVL